jgi:HEAT repeat protein
MTRAFLDDAVASFSAKPVAVQEVLREAAKDPSGRISMNALLESTRQGDQEAFNRIGQAARGFDAAQRLRAPWPIGESGNPEFAPLLDKLSDDQDSQVRAMAQKSRGKLGQAQFESKDAVPPLVDEEARSVSAEARARNKSAA